jgi:hypothetical protein
MMPSKMTTSQRAEAVFSQPDNRKYADDYIKIMRENPQLADNTQNRIQIYVLIVIVLHGLLWIAAVTQVTVAGFQIKDLSIISRARPVIVAYFMYQLLGTATLITIYERTLKVVTKHTRPELHHVGLDDLYIPQGVTLTGISIPWSGKMIDAVDTIFDVGIFLAIVAWEIYAYYWLFVDIIFMMQKHGYR